MGAGVVLSVGVECFLQRLVGHEVQSLEGHVHGELRGVAAVEGGRAVASEQRRDAVDHATIRRVEHLHPLLHHCNEKRRVLTRNCLMLILLFVVIAFFCTITFSLRAILYTTAGYT